MLPRSFRECLFLTSLPSAACSPEDVFHGPDWAHGFRGDSAQTIFIQPSLPRCVVLMICFSGRKSREIKGGVRKPKEIKENQRKSKESKGNQRKSNGNQRKSKEIRGNQMKSKGVKRNQRKAKEIKGSQRNSNEIEGHQRKTAMGSPNRP